MGRLGGTAVKRLPSAQGVIPVFWDRAPHRARAPGAAWPRCRPGPCTSPPTTVHSPTTWKLDRNHWTDKTTTCKDELPNYEGKIKMSICTWIEVRWVLASSAYLDVGEKEDQRIRISTKQGDTITLPAGIAHHFTLDEKNCVETTRLFVGEPAWTAYNRPSASRHFRERSYCLYVHKTLHKRF
uniref:acireductone dioxygenase (Fe(2+)-requiring) n=1 Tax=Ursus maritimus TaxID=29073 RepID=A0A452TI32_URSMA